MNRKLLNLVKNMNRKLLNLVKFIKKTNCERHFIDNGLKFILFLCIDIAPFVEDCEVLSLNEFVELVGRSR